MKRTNSLPRYSLLIGIIALSALSCGKGKSKGTFFVKGQLLDYPTEKPIPNLEVYVRYREPRGLGFPAIHEKVGSAITDSMGSFKFECGVYAGGGEYVIQPSGREIITPSIGDTVDVGILMK